MPLRYGSRVTGAIVISKLGLDQFDEDDIRLLEVLAGQASVALENARLYDQQRREAINAKALLAFLDEVSRAQSFDEICTRTVETAATLFESPVVSLWLQDGAGDFYRAAFCGSAELVDGRWSATASTLRVRVARAVPRRGRDRGAAARGRRRDRLDRRGEGQPGRGAGRGAAAARGVLVPGVGRAAEGAALLAAARGRRDRERAARREPRAGDRRLARGGARADRRGDGARRSAPSARRSGCRRRSRRTISSPRAWFGGALDELRSADRRRPRREVASARREPFALEPEQLAEITGAPGRALLAARRRAAPPRERPGRRADRDDRRARSRRAPASGCSPGSPTRPSSRSRASRTTRRSSERSSRPSRRWRTRSRRTTPTRRRTRAGSPTWRCSSAASSASTGGR